MPDKPDVLTLISYMIAAALLIPVGWWLKDQRLFGFGDWVVGLFY